MEIKRLAKANEKGLLGFGLGSKKKANAADSFESAGCVSLKRLPVKVSL